MDHVESLMFKTDDSTMRSQVYLQMAKDAIGELILRSGRELTSNAVLDEFNTRFERQCNLMGVRL